MPHATPTPYTVDAPLADHTVLQALRHWLPDQSWSQLRKVLRARRIAVNGVLCIDEARRLKPADIVEISLRPHAAPPTDKDVAIVYRDRDLVIVNKPARMMTLRHKAERSWKPPRKLRQPTLDEVLPRLLWKPTNEKLRRQVYSVHRIDRDTSGLLVFALNERTQSRLIELFRRHEALRVYRAVIPGAIEAQTIQNHLIRDRGDGLRGSSSVANKGKLAVTHLRALRRWPDYSEVECRLETGRTHQIRIHLAELGRPVCGDPVYRGPGGGPPVADASQAPRLALHAAQLGFVHPVHGRMVEFDAPWPEEMAPFLTRVSGGQRDLLSEPPPAAPPAAPRRRAPPAERSPDAEPEPRQES